LYLLFNLYLLLSFLYPTKANWRGQQKATCKGAQASLLSNAKHGPLSIAEVTAGLELRLRGPGAQQGRSPPTVGLALKTLKTVAFIVLFFFSSFFFFCFNNNKKENQNLL